MQHKDMYYIGFDIGGTKCAISLGKWDGDNIFILSRQETQTQHSPIKTFESLAPFVKKWTKEYDVQGAGISCGGPLDSKNGIIVSTPNLAEDWHGFHIVRYIQEMFGLRSKLENDPANPELILTARGIGYMFQRIA